MTDFCTERLTTSRKPHICQGCNRVIPGRTAYLRVSGKWDGQIGTSAYHPDCRAIEVRLNDEIEISSEDYLLLHEIVSSEPRQSARLLPPAVRARFPHISDDPTREPTSRDIVVDRALASDILLDELQARVLLAFGDERQRPQSEIERRISLPHYCAAYAIRRLVVKRLIESVPVEGRKDAVLTLSGAADRLIQDV